MNRCLLVRTSILALLASSSASAARPSRRARVTPPLISLTAPFPADRAVEQRLMLFIKALQLGQRQKAASMLSRRVPARERDALLGNRWLTRRPTSKADFGQVLFLPDLQIRTEQLHPSARTLIVLPRPRKKTALTGALRVIMRKESGAWKVEMHP